MKKSTVDQHSSHFRYWLLAALAEYRCCHPGEKESVEQTLAFIQQEPRAFDSKNRLGHLTGSGWVLNPGADKTLLTCHRKLKKWLQLGGHADGQPDLISVSHREVLEESGLTQLKLGSRQIFDLDIHAIPPAGDMPAHYHYDLRFLWQASEFEPPRHNHESLALAWVPLSRISDYTREPSILRMVAKSQVRPAGLQGG